MTITAFERDIAAQPDALRRVLAFYPEDGASALATAASQAMGASQVLFAAMGSSLAAAQPAADRIRRRSPAFAREASELLHYGEGSIPDDALVVLVSQSGRSIETIKLGERLRDRGHKRLIAVTNDPGSPLASLAAVTLPILAGEEATVSTKTFVTTFVVLHLLSVALVDRDPSGTYSDEAIPSELPEQLATVTERDDLADAAAEAMSGCGSLSVIARGPTVAAAEYGALITKETAAMPAEALSGGSFRHGPLEIAGPAIGVVILAPSGPGQALSVRLALETSGHGSPTWLIGDDAADLPTTSDRLRVMTLPAIDEAFAPLLMSVPIQRLAAALARQRGRVPGILLRSTKVTEIE